MSEQPASLDAIVTPNFSGRVAIVTGAGQGIGKVFTKALAMAGAIPIVAELNPERGAAVAGEIVSGGGQALAIPTDIGDPDSIARMALGVVERYGRIDILINNAGIFSTLEMRPFDQIPLDEWERVLRVNVIGQMLCARAVLPAMRKARWGRIINMSSGSITLGRPNYLHYTTSKAALVGMTRSMARELGADGITVNAILPGPVFTEIERKTVTPEQKVRLIAMQCIQREEKPADLVGTMLFLASDASAFLTGQAITVDGGATHP